MAKEIAEAGPTVRSLFQRLSDFFTSRVIDTKEVQSLAAEVAASDRRETKIDGLSQDEAMQTLEALSDEQFLRLLCVVARVYGINVSTSGQVVDDEDDHGTLGFDRLVLVQRVGGLVAIADTQAVGKDSPEALKARIAQLSEQLQNQATVLDLQRRKLSDAQTSQVEIARLLGRSLWHLSRDNGSAKSAAIREWDPSLRSADPEWDDDEED